MNAKVINTEEINGVKELLLYFFNEINTVSTSGFQILWNQHESGGRYVNLVGKGKTRILIYNTTIFLFLTQQYFYSIQWNQLNNWFNKGY